MAQSLSSEIRKTRRVAVGGGADVDPLEVVHREGGHEAGQLGPFEIAASFQGGPVDAPDAHGHRRIAPLEDEYVSAGQEGRPRGPEGLSGSVGRVDQGQLELLPDRALFDPAQGDVSPGSHRLGEDDQPTVFETQHGFHSLVGVEQSAPRRRRQEVGRETQGNAAGGVAPEAMALLEAHDQGAVGCTGQALRIVLVDTQGPAARAHEGPHLRLA